MFVRAGQAGTGTISEHTGKEVKRSAYIVELPLPAGKSRRVDGDLFTLVNEYLSEISTQPGDGRRIVPIETGRRNRKMGRY